MPGKVFISCGQRPPREENITDKVTELIKKNFDLDYFVAPKMQGVNDIDKIINELRSADYFLFIDFYRRDDKDWPVSLFAHQELALAHHLGFKEIIAFKEKAVTPQGIFKYVVAHPETFESEKELLKKVEKAVTKRNWTKDYSRNLVVTNITREGPFIYRDHTGAHDEYIWHAQVENRRIDAAAVNAVCVLDYIKFPDGEKRNCDDRSYLKWAFYQKGYQRTILPKDHGLLDIFAIHADELGIYLHSARDTPREPILRDNGEYELYYKVFSEGFPLLSFGVQVNYHYSSPTRGTWQNFTEAKLIK